MVLRLNCFPGYITKSVKNFVIAAPKQWRKVKVKNEQEYLLNLQSIFLRLINLQTNLYDRVSAIKCI